MKKHLCLIVLFSALGIQGLFAQTTPANALTNVNLHNADGSVTESATIVWRNGVIEAAGKNAAIPFDAYTIDGGDSLHVYPGFINGYATWGSPDTPRNLERLPEPGNPPYDRAGVQPERKPSILLQNDKNFEQALKAGFTASALIPKGFMLPGQVEIFYIAANHENVSLLKELAGLGGSYRSAPGGWGTGAYPSTLMGVMAKFRQVMFDAKALNEHMQYYTQNPEMPAPKRDNVLEAMFPLVNSNVPLFFEVDSKEDIERLFHLQDQFGLKVVIVSGKEAYAKADELKRRDIPVLASIDFTDAPKWYKPEDSSKKDEKGEDEVDKAEKISDEEKAYRERQLDAWKKEVSNIKALLDAGVKTGFASASLELKDYSKKIKTLLNEGGLTEAQLVQLLTVNTAQILGIQNTTGTIGTGKNASFSVFNKPAFEEKAKVIFNISNGELHEF